jgi:tetratricopeptide (TPR) repeat protein
MKRKHYKAKDFYAQGVEYFVMHCDYERALECATRAVELDPRYEEAYKMRAYMCALRDPDRALAYWTPRFKAAPNDYTVRIGLGKAHWQKGDYERALADFTCVVESFPQITEGLHSRARLYVEKGEYDKALSDYTYWNDFKSDDWNDYMSRARVYEALGAHGKARADRKKARRMRKKYLKYLQEGDKDDN